MNKLLHVILPFILVSFSVTSCQKLVEDKKRDLLIEVMTDGRWHVETFEQGSSNFTDDFKGYSFQFSQNGSVAGFKDSLPSTAGTWTPDVQNLSITSNFPDAQDPISRLNGTWKITDSGNDFVVAEMTTTAGKTVIHLRKNP